MRIETANVECFTIIDAPKLDPVVVVLQDVRPGHGRLIVECYGKAWSAYWGAMGARGVRQFVIDCDPTYIAGRLSDPDEDEAYVRRIVEAMKTALAAVPEQDRSA